jgi:hypothetical protein
MESVLDRERKCDCCKTKPAVCRFDRATVCAACYRELDAALVREGGRDGKSKTSSAA